METIQKLKENVEIFLPENGLEEKLNQAEKENRKLVIKLGFDPTAPDLHLGHAVVLKKLKEFQAAQGQISQALGRLLMITENYPNLKANEGFRNLQTQLEGTENRIKVARNDFNAAVKDYNTQVRSFPMNLFAGMFGFKPKEGFAAEPGSDKAPEVKF